MINQASSFTNDEVQQLITIAAWAYLRALGDGDFYTACAVDSNAAVHNVGKVYSAKTAAAAADSAVYTLHKYHDCTIEKASRIVDLLLRIWDAAPKDASVQFTLRAGWYEGGLPSITMGHKLAASYMATRLPPEVIDEVRAPFPAFLLEIPEGLLTAHDDTDGALVNIRRALVGSDPVINGWCVCAYTDGQSSLWRKHKLLSQLVAKWDPSETVDSPFGLHLDSMDARSIELLGRLIICAMLHMTGGAVKQIGKGHGLHQSGASRRAGAKPVSRVFQLCHDVKHDVRQVVRDYVAGAGTKLTTQYLACGYWKQQHYGPRNTLRRRQFIEPAWHGPVDAPIAQRSHVLDETNGQIRG